jgi:hypothetical protein
VAHAKHDQVRRRYEQRCGYCGVSEIDAGGELTVDHYRPLAEGGDDSDDNLIYACIRCNLYKGDFYPDEQELACGHRVLHPLQDDLAAHLRPNHQTGELEALAEAGRFHIELLHLNRPQLVSLRLRRQADSLAATKLRLVEAENEKLRLVEAENERLRTLLAATEQYIAKLERLLGFFPDME